MGIATEAAVIGTNYSYCHRIPVEGLEMKTVFAVLILSIMSAIVGIFASTELHEMAIATGSSNDTLRATTADATPAQPSQKIQQWVNH